MKSTDQLLKKPLDVQQRTQLLHGWNPEPTEYPETTVKELFEKQAAERSEAVALIFKEQHLSYGELNAQANRLAHHLIELGVKSGKTVALYLERGPSQIIATLAILKAGAAYIPLDIEFPVQRIAQMLEDALPRVVLSHSSLVESLPETGGEIVLSIDELIAELNDYSGSNPKGSSDPDALAYIMYTSGSTGRPKGVEVVHRGIVRLLFGVDYVPLNTDTIILHMAAVSFDASTFEVWGALLHGGTCVLCPSRVPTLDLIGKLLAEHRVNTFWMTAALFNLVIAEVPGILKPVKYLLTGGEALSVWHVEKALRELPGTQLINGYGPTENTTFSTTYAFDRDSFDPEAPIPIGRAIGNSTVYVLDEKLQPVPVGTLGELYVGGDGLARGYVNRPDLTAECFLPDPFSSKPNARMYKTGDRVCWNPKGLIEFIGRVDNQIKLRGFRIELQEIDIALGSFPEVEQAVTVVYEDTVRGKWLAGFVKVDDPENFSVDALKIFAYKTLPDYMVPSALVPVSEWSYTPSGKLDRKALLKPSIANSRYAEEEIHYESETEKGLAEIWSEVLGFEDIPRAADFFELGGDSLRAVTLFLRIQQRFGCDLPLSTLLRFATLDALARCIDGGEGDIFPGCRSLKLIQQGKEGVAPLFLVHGGAGNILCFSTFSKNLDSGQPVYAFQWSGWDGGHGETSIEEMAEVYCAELLTVFPDTPVRIGGYCIGGFIAIELVQRLKELGVEVLGPLVVFDSPNLRSKTYHPSDSDSSGTALPWVKRTSVYTLARRIRTRLSLRKVERRALSGEEIPIAGRNWYCGQTQQAAVRKHHSAGTDVPVLYFRSDDQGSDMMLSGWWSGLYMGFDELCKGPFEAHVIGGGHDKIMDHPQLAEWVMEAIGSSKR